MRLSGKKCFVVLAGFLAVFASSGVSSATAEEYLLEWDRKEGRLERLTQYIGTYRYQAILDDPLVREELGNMLGDNLSLFIRNLMGGQGSIDFRGSWLVLRGGRTVENQLESALLVVDVFIGEVHAGILTNGKTTIYSEEKSIYSVPMPLMEWVWGDVVESLWTTIPSASFEWIQ